MRKDRGVALVIVLWIMAILTLLLYAFLMEMQSEVALADGFVNRKKAEQLGLSGVDKMVQTIKALKQPQHTLADTWSHDETSWYEVEVGDGVFTAVHPDFKDSKVRWGLIDEASKLNLNMATKEVLLKLPGMTEEIADSVVDWRDTDSDQQPSGAENTYYGTLTPAYLCKNAPFETVEELLYVRGVTAALFWGEDRDQNGILDPGEDTDEDGEMDYGFYPFLTVHSVDKDLRADGSARLDLNTGRQDFQKQLGEVLGGQKVNQLMAAPPFQSVAHLLDYISPEQFKQIADWVTIAQGQADIPGRININTAPKQVLMCLPNIQEEFVDAILTYRTTEGVNLSNIGWVLDVSLDDNLKRAQLKEIANFITVRSYQFRADVVGRIGARIEGTNTADEEKPFAFKRFVAIYDAGAETPRLVYFKDMTALGFPYDPWEKPQSP